MWRFQGLAVPYDLVAHKNRKRWIFPADVRLTGTIVPVLRDHDHSQRIGSVEMLPSGNGSTGLRLTGVTRSPVKAGMGLSIGFFPVEMEMVAGRRVVRVAGLEEVSIVRAPAWPDCVITEVEEVSTWPRTLAHM